jgi:hypothetical protein
MKIHTQFLPPPIVMRCFDWLATTDDYQPGDLIGYGATEQQAIEDLLSQLGETQ